MSDTLKERAKNSIKTISELVNNFHYGDQVEEFFKALTCQHRTLQQNVIRLFLKVIKKYGDLERFDPRNEASVKACKELAEFITERNLDGLPTV